MQDGVTGEAGIVFVAGVDGDVDVVEILTVSQLRGDAAKWILLHDYCMNQLFWGHRELAIDVEVLNGLAIGVGGRHGLGKVLIN